MKNEINKTIEDNIELYVDALQFSWKMNSEVCELLNRIYFNSKRDFRDVLEKSTVKDFSNYQHDHTTSIELCTADNFNEADLSFLNINLLERHSIFDYKIFNTYEEAAQHYPQLYYLVREDYVKVIDEFLFSHLSDYVRTNEGRFLKKLSDSITIEFDLRAEREIQTSIYDYTFPSLWIIKGKERLYQRADLRTLLFIDGKSFFSFYVWCNEMTYDENGRLIKLTNLDGEPVIYHFEESEKYVITNTYDKIEQWNNYIGALIGLFVHHFRLYEKWLDKIFNEH